MSNLMQTWGPFQTFAKMDEEVDHCFTGRCRSPRETTLARWTPAVDVSEDPEGIRLAVDLPGLRRDEVRVTVEGNTLSISGTRDFKREEKKDNYHRIERSYGTFARQFTLPTTINAERVEAEMTNGVLSILLPKREEAKPRQVEVKVK